MKTVQEYKIDRFRSEYFHSLGQLYKKTFGTGISFEDYQKKYNTEWLGLSFISFVAIEKNSNQVVAHFGVVPVNINIYNKKFIAAQSSDAMTDKKHQKKGLFKRLAEEVCKYCESHGVLLMFSQPNQASYHSFLNVFHFKHVDDIVRWDLKLRFKTAPLAKLPLPRIIEKGYRKYCFLLLKKYIVKEPVDLTNTLPSTAIKVVRDRNYISYKATVDKYFIRIEKALLWIKLTDVFWIGEVGDYEQITLKVLKTLKRVAFLLGYNTITFHLNRAMAKPYFLQYFKEYNTEPSTIFFFDEEYANLNLILTAADFDTW